MRFLVVGLGSMGKRRIRNLLALGYDDIVGYDPRPDRRREVYGKHHIDSISDFNSALEKNPDIMIISTPPDLHRKYAEIAIKNNIHFFTEVNLSSTDILAITKMMKGRSIIGSPSCTMRFHPVTKVIKKLLTSNSIGKIHTIYHHFGHFLPDWHPWEDYRKFYAAKRETGGAREIVPFELVWLTQLFSEIKSVYGDIEKLSSLDVDIDDIYQSLLEFKNKIFCMLVVDVITKPSIRETKIIGAKGAILCDFNEGYVKISRGEGWKTIKVKMGKVAKGYKGSTPPETLYEEEMQSFIDAVKRRRKYPHSFHDELKILKVLDAIELSNKMKKRIYLR